MIIILCLNEWRLKRDTQTKWLGYLPLVLFIFLFFFFILPSIYSCECVCVCVRTFLFSELVNFLFSFLFIFTKHIFARFRLIGTFIFDAPLHIIKQDKRARDSCWPRQSRSRGNTYIQRTLTISRFLFFKCFFICPSSSLCIGIIHTHTHIYI